MGVSTLCFASQPGCFQSWFEGELFSSLALSIARSLGCPTWLRFSFANETTSEADDDLSFFCWTPF